MARNRLYIFITLPGDKVDNMLKMLKTLELHYHMR